jgi:LDH2 family malate/lactate/ureidoglycolate dehydrogenase
MSHYFFNETKRIDAKVLRSWVGKIFTSIGLSEADATLTAESLVEADARGVYSHGCVRVPLYVKRIECKSVDPKAQPFIQREQGAMALVDGVNASGQVVGAFAMHKAIDLAKTFGISFVTARNSNHYGAAAWYAMMALQHNMIGISTSIGGGNLMPVYGGAERRVGNNPFSVAIPADKRDAVVLDMAQSVVAKGKIILASKTNAPIPAEWALDAEGLPTTDANAALSGFLRTVGDYKGSGLSIVIGMLSSMLANAAIGPSLRDVYEDFEPLNKGHSFMAIRLDFLADAEEFKRNMDVQIDFIKQSKRAPGVEEIFLPGETEARNHRRQMAIGIEMPAEVLNELATLSERFNVAVPIATDSPFADLTTTGDTF